MAIPTGEQQGVAGHITVGDYVTMIAAAQLTLFNFISQFSTSFNLLFADVVLITVPPLIVFLFFQRQIVAGMTAGAVKG